MKQKQNSILVFDLKLRINRQAFKFSFGTIIKWLAVLVIPALKYFLESRGGR